MISDSTRLLRLKNDKFRRRFATLLSLWATANASSAFADVTTSVQAAARAQTATNPYLEAGESTESASVTLSISPTVAVGDEITTVKLIGRVLHTEFSRRYDGFTNLGGTALLNHKIASNLDVAASVSYDRAVVGIGDILTPSSSPVSVGGSVDQTVAGDTALNGLRQRRLFLTSDVGIHYRASSRDIFEFGGSFGSSRYPGSVNIQNYKTFGYRASYGNKISDAIQVGIQANWARTDYSNTRVGDSRVYGVQGTVAATFAPRWTLRMAAGPSFAATRTATGIVHQTSVGGSLNLCNSNKLVQACAFASRSYQPSVLGGIRSLTNWGFSYSRRLDERSDIQGSTGFGRAPRPAIGGGSVTNGFARADLTYNRRFSRTVTGYASVGYADSFRDATTRHANYQLSAGVTFLFGKNR